MSPDLRLRLHATQAQPCFPAASNALALPGGNGIFTATPAERITHYTLLRKVVCQMGALPPLETPTRKGGTLPLHGAHTAFSCYPALRLYRLSKSPRGIDVVSLTLGNSRLPAGYRLVAHRQLSGQLRLCHTAVFTEFFDDSAGYIGIHKRHLLINRIRRFRQRLNLRRIEESDRLCPHARIYPFTWLYFFLNRRSFIPQ